MRARSILVAGAAAAGALTVLVTHDGPHAWCTYPEPQAVSALQVVAAHVAAIHRNSPEQSVSESTIQAALMAECAK